MERNYNVCSKECGGAQKCVICKKFVHLICGTPVGGEDSERYGQSIECQNCKSTSTKSKGIFICLFCRHSEEGFCKMLLILLYLITRF